MMKHRSILINLLAAILLSLLTVSGSQAQEPAGEISPQAAVGTAFTYQGRLSDTSGPVNGTCDFRFRLYSAASGGTLLGTDTVNSVPVSDGYFGVVLNDSGEFGANAFQGDARWLEIRVNCGGGDINLSPHQPLTAAPYALYALNADLLDGQHASSFAGAAHNHWGESWSGSGTGLTLNSSSDIGIRGNSSGSVGIGVEGYSTGIYGTGVYGHSTGSNSYGVYGGSSGGYGYGIYGHSTDSFGTGVCGGSIGSYGTTGVSGFGGTGVYGSSSSSSGTGVYGTSSGGYGYGVYGYSSGSSGYGVYGYSYYSSGHAGYFSGRVHVTGYLSKAGGGFKIDHPLDPENQYLNHSFVESPDMKNIYDGVVVLDANGEAWVELAEWFQALNQDFRYQLTPIGGPGPGLYIAEEIQNNRFKIAGGEAGMKVSWQVTGIRHDAYAEDHPIPVEEGKPAAEQGTYLHPVEHGQAETLGLDYQRNQALGQPEPPPPPVLKTEPEPPPEPPAPPEESP